jgi:hypothetical protein
VAPPKAMRAINFVGGGVIRAFTLVMPTADVQAMLPPDLELGAQTLTEPGLHPVVLYFQEMVSAHMNIPVPMPAVTYHEQILGIPYCYSKANSVQGRHGPFYHMPNLWLDNWQAIVGGRMWYSFPKVKGVATLTAAQNGTPARWAMADMGGQPQIALNYEPVGDFEPLHTQPNFANFCVGPQGIMNQPLVVRMPFGVGPVLQASHFDKKWDDAVIRPLRATMEISKSFSTGLPTGRFPAHGWGEGIDTSPLGAFEVHARWRESFSYPLGLETAEHAPKYA